MEPKSAALGAVGTLLLGGLAFGLISTANAENQPAPAVSTSVMPSAPTEATPTITPEPLVTTEAPVSTAEPEPAVVEPAPAVVEPAPVVVEPAPVVVAPAPVYVAPEQPVAVPGPAAEGQVNKPAEPGDIKNANRVPLPAPTTAP